jgi:hypothetical protein
MLSCQRIGKIPYWPVTASALIATIGEFNNFRMAEIAGHIHSTSALHINKSCSG